MVAVAFWIAVVPVTVSLIVFVTAVCMWVRDEVERVRRVHEIARFDWQSNRRLR